jgi:hypothetical protein
MRFRDSKKVPYKSALQMRTFLCRNRASGCATVAAAGSTCLPSDGPPPPPAVFDQALAPDNHRADELVQICPANSERGVAQPVASVLERAPQRGAANDRPRSKLGTVPLPKSRVRCKSPPNHATPFGQRAGCAGERKAAARATTRSGDRASTRRGAPLVETGATG